MEDFKKELALLCFNSGITLESLKECVNNWGNEGKDRNTPVINLEKMVEGLKYICTLDGKDYYFSEDEYLNNVDWHTAKDFADSLGKEWELPSMEVLKHMHLKMEYLGIGRSEWLWSGDEYSSTYAWSQHFTTGDHLTNKTYYSHRLARPVYVIDSFGW